MTFERYNTEHHSSNRGPAWAMRIPQRDQSPSSSRRFVIAFYSRRTSGRQPDVDAWVEREESQWYKVTGRDGKTVSKSALHHRSVSIEIPKSRRRLTLTSGLEYIVAEALGMETLTGESAAMAVHNMFWTHFVTDDEGLSHLCRHAPGDSSAYYARARLQGYETKIGDTDEDIKDTKEGELSIHDVQHIIAEATMDRELTRGTVKQTPFYLSELGDRAKHFIYTNHVLRDAIEAVMLTDEDDQRKHQLIREFVVHEMPSREHIYAMIIYATSDSAPLLGLRACQRLEKNVDPTLWDDLDQLRQKTDVGKKVVLKFLRSQFKGRHL